MSKRKNKEAPLPFDYYFTVFDGSMKNQFGLSWIAINSVAADVRVRTIDFNAKGGSRKTAVVVCSGDKPIDVEACAKALYEVHGNEPKTWKQRLRFEVIALVNWVLR